MQPDLKFWDFAGGVVAGSLAGGVAGLLARRGFRGSSSPRTADTAAIFARIGTFWVVGGLVWLTLAKRRRA